ncbi:DUF4838 domain-containing protein [Sulfidibacter corallicola]|uniref:DUF4838 domain-containing protein n=1 Tax=Sulfidibacter corallicola TaxID=2818388 RepID=A0A8A4TKL8_SULCO|nr:DUF4838 domain-containing protein [Sulfidibacter corallicola]QTD50123.1 DUF4838 domain-containing protein [Sulfidibacter corallicola]
MVRPFFTFLATLSLAATNAFAYTEIHFVDNGSDTSIISSNNGGDTQLTNAITFFIDTIETSTGATIPHNTGSSNQQIHIGVTTYVDSLVDDGTIDLGDLKTDGFHIEMFTVVTKMATEYRLVVVGPTTAGTKNGVVHLLEHPDWLGLRLLMPGDDGTVIPSLTDITWDTLDVIHEIPDFGVRRQSYGTASTDMNDWMIRMRLGPFNKSKLFAHNLYTLFPKTVYSTSDPEIYPRVNPEGTTRYIPVSDTDAKWNPVFTEPKTLLYGVRQVRSHFDTNPTQNEFSLGANDSARYDQPEYLAQDEPRHTYHGLANYADLYFNWVNQVADRINRPRDTRIDAHYTFETFVDADEDTLPDASGLLHNLDEQGTLTLVDEDAMPGKVGQFDGSTTALVLPDSTNAPIFHETTGFSVSCWIKTDSVSALQYLLDNKEGATTSATGYNLRITASGKLAATLVADHKTLSEEVTTELETTQGMQTGEWYLATLTVDRGTSTAKLYLKGEGDTIDSVDTETLDTNFDTMTPTDPFTIGAHSNVNGDYFDGLMDGFIFWDEPLTSTEVEDLYDSLVPLRDASMPAYWPMDFAGFSDQGPYSVDCSSNDHHLAVTEYPNMSGTIEWVPDGIVGGAMKFDDGWLVLPSSTTIDIQKLSFSVSLWFKPDGTGLQFLIDNKSGNSGGQGFNLNINANGYLATRIVGQHSSGTPTYIFDLNTDDGNAGTDTDEITTGEWNHAVLVVDRTGSTDTASLYLNGSFMKSGNLDANLDKIVALLPMHLGALSADPDDTDFVFNGLMDEVLIFNRPLTSSQVSDLYGSGAPDPFFEPRQFGTYAYNQTVEPPSDFYLHPYVMTSVTHDLSMPIPFVGRQSLLDAWAARAPELGWYDYRYGAPYLIPRIDLAYYQSQLKTLRAAGVDYLFTELFPNFGEGPNPYLTMRLMWDVDLDLAIAKTAWYEDAVGSGDAATNLADYFAIWETVWADYVPLTVWFQPPTTFLRYFLPYYLEATDLALDFDAARTAINAVVTNTTELTPERTRAEILETAFDYYEASGKLYHAERDIYGPSLPTASDADTLLTTMANFEGDRAVFVDDNASDIHLKHRLDFRTWPRIDNYSENNILGLRPFLEPPIEDATLETNLEGERDDTNNRDSVRFQAKAVLNQTDGVSTPINSNSDFSSGLTNWNVTAQNSPEVDSGVIRWDQPENEALTQGFTATANNWYAVTARIKAEDLPFDTDDYYVQVRLFGSSDAYIKQVKPSFDRWIDIGVVGKITTTSATISLQFFHFFDEAMVFPVVVDHFEVWDLGSAP